MVLVPLCLHTLGGNKLKAILPSGQERQPFQAPQSVWKGPPQKATWVESRHAQLLGTTLAASSERLVQCCPKVRGSAQQFPEAPCPRCHPFHGCSAALPALCVLWAGGANKTPQAFSRSLSADTGGLWIRPPMVCSKSDADIFKLQRWECWKS